MLLHNALDRIISNDTKVGVLRILFKYGKEWTGRQISKELNISPTTSSKFLKSLSEEGIVNVRGAGRAYLYSLNYKNYFVKNLLQQFFEKENHVHDAIISTIRKALLKSGTSIESAAIFGSLARKTETAGSDIDLLVITKTLRKRKDIENALNGISLYLAQNFQTAISPYILSSRQFKAKYDERAAIIHEITKAHILVMGKSIERAAL